MIFLIKQKTPVIVFMVVFLMANNLLSQNNVGINTLTPTHKLDVNGEARIRTISDTINFSHLLLPDANGVVKKVIFDTVLSKIQDSSEWIDGTKVGLTPGAIYARKALTNGDTVVVDTNGNMGIGVNNTSQNSKLHIVTSGTNKNAIMIGDGPFPIFGNQDNIVFSDRNTNSGDRLIRWLDGNGNMVSQIIGYFGGPLPPEASATLTLQGNEGIGFMTRENLINKHRLFIEKGGNVGIGTTVPTSKLEVNGSVANAIITTTANLILDSTHHTVIVTGGTPTITLPAATGINGRKYIIVNQTGTAISTGINYINFTGASVNTIPPNSAITVQNNNVSWYRVQ